MEAKWAQAMSAIDALKAENRTLKGLCATLLEPYALLIFRTADTDGRQTRRAVELTLAELQQLTATFEEVSAVLERV